MSIMQDLHTVGLNPFAVQLLAESLLKSALAQMTVGNPQGLFFPIQQGDCKDWAGVRITLDAIPDSSRATVQPAESPKRGDPCEVQDQVEDSPTFRQWLPARFVALDLVAGEPIVQIDKRMPWFATWGSVRGITKPA